MAIRYAVATGNWSATATWDGGTLPTSADDVYSNNRTVTIDQDVTVVTLRNGSNASPAITQGGTFACSTARTITATAAGNGIISASGSVLTFTGTANFTLNANIIGPTVNGNCVSHGSTGTLTITGNVTANNVNNSPAVSASSGPVSVTGLITGGATNGGTNAAIHSTGLTAHVTVVGNVVGGTNGVGAIQITGNNSILTVTGNVTANAAAGAAAPVIVLTGSNATRWHSVVGTLTAANTSGALGSHALTDSNAAGGGVSIGGSLVDSSQGDSAILVRRTRCIATLNTTRQYTASASYPSGGLITYGSLDYIPNNVPVPADVRSGTVYGNSSFTGTCAVPAAASVGYGVPIDNTTGTAALTPAAVWNALTSGMSTSGSIGERLKTAATTATTGDQIAAIFP